MSPDNRFKPPEAAVLPAPGTATYSRGPAIVLAAAGLVQLLWMALRGSRVLMLVSDGVMNPVGPFLCTLGALCLYAGIVRLLMRADRGRNFFLAAAVLAVLGLWIIGRLELMYLSMFWGFTLVAIAGAAGAVLVWPRGRARGEPA